ncbi:dihydroorotate dehydrogenase PyrD [Thermacetogenium phaeum DSM 12270]|uniref:dihydrouracil dehydrogenase (NAD(+)) n=1 Tax=Thermacetogenium phaeum (strain ATCC BAA-254 / DSM 26808 / PB) TaxID=1089553 RepID=K4LX85_THEPS|nr:4Fe-4S binding protein [Thermacetogenium phaeum]AFV12589.1 dihydroorotate dehydrogenase PyrD [Thermacetogenium phaeum DSM 12270]
MADLSVEVAGVKFKNPVILASATPTMDRYGMKRGIDGGAAGAIAKSLFGESGKLGRKFPRPRFKLFDYKDYPGYPNELPHAFTLHSLEECSHYGYEEYMDDINKAKDMVGDEGVIMASLSGATMDEWEAMCKMVNETKADWVELNVSCPFAADMGVKMGAGAVELCPEITKLCAGILKKPFSVKISPQAADPVAIAEEVEKAGAMAVNLSARLSGIMIDIETARPIGPGAMGGWGGPYLIGYGLKIVSQAARRLNIPIIAGLGVWDWQDIIRYTMVGASLVQSGAGIMLQGYNISKKWVENINAWLDSKGYSSLDEIRGVALPNILKTRDIEREPEGVHAVVDFKKCNKCGTCIRSCFYAAIKLTKAGAIVNPEVCDGCGMCMEVCPQNAVSMSKGR